MKLKVVGWTYSYNPDYEEIEDSWVSRQALIDCIKQNGYDFSGWDHQELDYCAPVYNNGKIKNYSQRGFGDVMAEAHGEYGPFDYALYMMHYDDAVLPTVAPPKEFDREEDLVEEFVLEVEDGIIEGAISSCQIRYPVVDSILYIGRNDFLTLTCKGKSQRFIVGDVVREMDVSQEKSLELFSAMYDHDDQERAERAKEEYANAPYVLVIQLKAV